MENRNELTEIECNLIRSTMIESVINFTDIIGKKIDELDLQVQLLAESLNMTESNIIYSRIESLKAKLSVSARNIENIQTVIIISLIKE